MSQRSRTGCTTCRERKVKCDERHPTCNACHRLTLPGSWIPQARRKRTRRIHQQSYPHNFKLACGFAHPRPLRPKTPLSHLSHLGVLGPIPPVLDASRIPCANSVLLSLKDRRCLEYFPFSTLVLFSGKPWKWSCLAYIYHKLAPQNSTIMYMIIAQSASELQTFGQSDLRPNSQHAARNYGIALKELNLLLNQDVKPDLDSSLTCLFLMIHYELKFGYSTQNLLIHLKGAEALRKSENYNLVPSGKNWMSSDQNNMAVAETQPFSSLSALLLVWIFSYVSLGDGIHTASDSFATKLYHSLTSSDCFLVRAARMAHSHCWGSEYPQDAWLDDMENYRALALMHESFSLLFRVWKLWSIPTQKHETVYLVEDDLFRRLQHLRHTYEDIFKMAKQTYHAQARRALYTAQSAVVSYSSLVLFHRHMLYQDSPMEECHFEALSTIMNVAFESYTYDKRMMARFSRALLMAAIETPDLIYKGWIRDRLWEVRNNDRQSFIASETLDQMMRSGKDDAKFCFEYMHGYSSR